MDIHLTVINSDNSTNADRLVNFRRNDVRWTYSDGWGIAWRAIPLRWWDDASYLAYQADDRCAEE